MIKTNKYRLQHNRDNHSIINQVRLSNTPSKSGKKMTENE